MKRLLTAIISIALLGLAPLALTSAASAAPVDSIERVPGASAPTGGEFETQAKRNRKVSAKPGKNLTMKGRVFPEYANSKVQIKRSSRLRGGYTTWKTVKTNRQGYYSVRLVAPNRVGKSYYHFAYVKARGDYRAALSENGVRTYKRRR